MAKPSPSQPVENDEAAAPTKGHATPSRKEQEAARKRPLVPTDRRLAAKQSRTQTQAARDRARVGMANGEEKYLPVRDKGPQKRYVRDYIDARFSIGEVLLPLLVVVIIGTFVESIAVYVFIGVYSIFAIVIVEAIIVTVILRRKLAEKFGKEKVERGVTWYAAMRMVQLRVLRLPKPQVKRGDFPH
jgi:Protein of unknown function (DUF3043)